jgi:hypothetical protein
MGGVRPWLAERRGHRRTIIMMHRRTAGVAPRLQHDSRPATEESKVRDNASARVQRRFEVLRTETPDQTRKWFRRNHSPNQQ